MTDEQHHRNSERPLVSLFMPVYNGAEHLSETIDSVLAQTYPDFELVAVDDGSTDSSWEILERYALRDPRVRPHRLDSNQGHHAASNAAVARCRGGYLLRIDQDDLATPKRVELAVEAFEQHPDVGFVYSRYLRWLPDGSRHEREPPGSDTALRVHHMFHMSLCHATFAFRRQVLESLDGPYMNVAGPQDYDLSVRSLEITASYCIPVPLAVYRQSTMAMTELYNDTMDAAVEEISDRQLALYLSETEIPAVRRSFELGLQAGDQRAVRSMHRFLAELPGSDPRIDPAEIAAIRRSWTRRTMRSMGAGRTPRSPGLVWAVARNDPRGFAGWLRSELAGLPRMAVIKGSTARARW